MNKTTLKDKINSLPLAIFFDIDGTLINHKGGPYDDDLKAMEEALDKGHFLFINTGRSFSNIPNNVLNLHLWKGVAAGGGAHILLNENTAQKPLFKTIYHKWIDEKLLYDLCALYIKNRKCFILEGENDCYIINPLKKNKDTHSFKIITMPGDLLTKYKGDYITKMTVEDKLSSEEIKMLETNFQINIFPDYSEAVIKGENKARAMEIILGSVGITRDRSIAVGDAINDIDMIRYAGLGAAMGNAHPDVKSVAAIVTKNCGEGGVAGILRRYAL